MSFSRENTKKIPKFAKCKYAWGVADSIVVEPPFFANHEGTFTELDSDFILQLLKNVISIKIRFVVFNHIDTVLKFKLNAINECWKKKIF